MDPQQSAGTSKEYLHLLTKLVKALSPHNKITPQGIDALVSVDGSGLDEAAIDKLSTQFAPVRVADALAATLEDGPERVAKELERTEAALRAIIEYKPTGHFANPHEELLHLFTWHPDYYQSVDIRRFNPAYVQMSFAGMFSREVPTAVDMLGPNRGENIANMYFAALQLANGFPPHHSDRCTENMFNIAFLHGSGSEGVGNAIKEMQRKSKKQHLEYIVRLPSEYLKAFLFHGNVTSSEMTVYDFLDSFTGRFEESKQSREGLPNALSELSGDYANRLFRHEILSEPLTFISSMPSENLHRFLYAFSVKRYEDILELFFDDLPKMPHLWTLNQQRFDKDADYFRFAEFVVHSSEEIAAISNDRNENALSAVQRHVLDNHRPIFSQLQASHDHSQYLFRALRAYESPRGRYYGLDQDALKAYAETGFYISNIFEERAVTLLESLLTGRHARLHQLGGRLGAAFKDEAFKERFGEQASDPESRLELLAFFANFGTESQALQRSVVNGDTTLEACLSGYRLLQARGIEPTPHLLQLLASAPQQEQLANSWAGLLASRFGQRFDAQDELHRNLAYTQFARLVEDAHFRKQASKDFDFKWDFESYRRLLTDHGKMGAQERERSYDFEIACAAYESAALMGFIREAKQRADALGREVLVVPNLSYGYLPLVPLYHNLLEEGVKIFIGAKIGSTASHDNPTIFDKSLFQGVEEYLFAKKPVVIVVDGTKHFTNKSDGQPDARYPDAYQGYLNYIIALNDAAGRLDATYITKTEDDLRALRQQFAFNEFVEEHKEKPQARGLYRFGLWNTAQLPLVIRKNRKNAETHPPLSISNIAGPTMIFCNVGLLDDQIPASIKERYTHSMHHQPAFFDDSGHILSLELRISEEGIRAHNAIEPLLREAYASLTTGGSARPGAAYMTGHPNHIVRTAQRLA